MRMFCSLFCLALFCFHAVQAGAETATAGRVKTLTGTAQIIRGSQILPVAVGDVVLTNDTLTTGEGASLGLMLEDDTVLSMGPGSSMTLQDFVFEPQSELFALAIRLVKGSFAYMSGVIGRLAPEKIRIETPDVVIATLGTKFVVSVEGKK